ncbi:MAG: hypothetical protein JNL11_00100 [Bdellovibrionaceae bacterium]|nr:hypothetical protein [Pseudobdellovibrionaceae bacterium]
MILKSKLNILIVSLTAISFSSVANAGYGRTEMTCIDNQGKTVASIADDLGTGKSASVKINSVKGAIYQMNKPEVLTFLVSKDFTVMSAFSTQKGNFIQIAGLNGKSVIPKNNEDVVVKFKGTVATYGDYETAIEENLDCEFYYF